MAVLHFTCAGVFILSLAALCFVFAARDRRHGGHPRLHRTCGGLILAAVAWAVVGFVVDLDVGWLTSLYLAEVVSVWSFRHVVAGQGRRPGPRRPAPATAQRSPTQSSAQKGSQQTSAPVIQSSRPSSTTAWNAALRDAHRGAG